ncbi:MarC family protein [Chthonobacter albigriseus]|uniref:MarC family protein n=1 Tax=Chthonobacter albigriseus TaxID=1683161 RepID=UPI0015EEB6F4|nr:MarC family protein [Chthonobacter albigriseus]
MLDDFLLNAFATLLVTIDPMGLAPIFLGVTRGAAPAMRRTIAIRGSVIAGAILIGFALTGTTVLTFLGISLPAFRIAGGLLLFWIAFEMVFEKRDKRKQASAEQALAQERGEGPRPHGATGEDLRHIAVFPLAIPLIAGPGAISATILLASEAQDLLWLAMLVGLIVLMIGSCLLVFIASDRVDRYLGDTGRSVLTRLLGVLLSALAVQFVADGVKAIMA